MAAPPAPLAVLRGEPHASVNDLSFLSWRGHTVLAASHADGNVCLWELQSRRAAACVVASAGGALCAREWDDDGTLLVCVYKYPLCAWVGD